MLGSAYHKIADQVAEWLKEVHECNINSSTKTIADSLKDIKLDIDDEIVSFDVCSFYTNVTLYEAIIALNCCFQEDIRSHQLIRLKTCRNL